MSERRAIAALRVHPRNAAIYGDEADETLVASVKLFGVIDPLLVTPQDVVISGHRRLGAARQAGLEEVEVVVRPVADDLEAVALILEANKNRSKTHEQEAREGREALLLEQGLAKERQKAGAAQTNAQRWGSGSLQKTVSEATTNRPQARDLAGQRVGKSGPWVERAAKVVDIIDRLVAEGNGVDLQEVRAALNEHGVWPAYEACVRLGYIEVPRTRKAEPSNGRAQVVPDAPAPAPEPAPREHVAPAESWQQWEPQQEPHAATGAHPADGAREEGAAPTGAPPEDTPQEEEGWAQVGRDPITLEQWGRLSAEEQQAVLEHGATVATSFNKQDTSHIEWARWSWNPVTGCLHNCSYCYARDIAERFYPQGFVPAIVPHKLGAPAHTKVPVDAAFNVAYKNVFTCSMADLFGKWVPREWIEAVLAQGAPTRSGTSSF